MRVDRLGATVPSATASGSPFLEKYDNCPRILGARVGSRGGRKQPAVGSSSGGGGNGMARENLNSRVATAWPELFLSLG